MRFVVIGPGAMGTIFATALAKDGHDVTLLGRQSTNLDRIRELGLRLKTRDGTTSRVTVPITADPCVAASAEVLLLLVKASDTASAMKTVKSHLSQESILLTLQNGLGNAEKMRQVLGERARVLVGTTSQAATRVSANLVVHAGVGPTLIGYETARDAPDAARLAAMFTAAGLPASAVPDIECWLWRKAAINAAINGLTALGGFSNGVVALRPDLLHASETVAEEVAAVAHAQGHEVGEVRRAVLETVTATAANRSSMLQDLEAGRETEVDAIYGAIQRIAIEVDVATPRIDLLAALIRAKTQNELTKDPTDG